MFASAHKKALRKKIFGLNYILTAHGGDVINYDPRFMAVYPFLIGIWKIIIDASEKITSPSAYLKTEIIKNYKGLDDNKIEVIPYGIRADKFVPLKKEKIILLASRLSVYKGVHDFLAAARDVDLGGWQIKIVGDGPYRGVLEKLVLEYHLKDKVEFLGWIDNKSDEFRNLYGRASIFILASWFENMNVTLLEAMQAGCAILASDVGGNSEVVGKNGLFEGKNSNDLGNKLRDIINDSDKINEMGVAAQARVKSFSWEKIMERYKRVYELYV